MTKWLLPRQRGQIWQLRKVDEPRALCELRGAAGSLVNGYLDIYLGFDVSAFYHLPERNLFGPDPTKPKHGSHSRLEEDCGGGV